MNIQRMHQEVKLRGNKINSNHYPDLPSAFIDDYLNDAQELFIESYYNPDDLTKRGWEGTQQITDFFSNITIHNEVITPTLVSSGIYKIQLSNLSKPYRHFLRLVVTTSCGEMSVEIINHNELDAVLKDENRKPSSIWKKCVGVFVSNNNNNPNTDIFIYTGNQYTISNSKISYIKNPRKMFFGGYNTLEYINGDDLAPTALSQPINCELNNNSHTFIVDIAVQLIHGSLENINNIQLIESKIQKAL